MNKPKPKKINDTALRVLEVLKLLMYQDYSKDALMDIIGDNQSLEPVHRNETLNKYFNTFKLLGADIVKIGDKYTLKNAPICMKLSDENIETLLFLFEYAKNICTDSERSHIDKLIEDIRKFLDTDTRSKIYFLKEKIQTKYKKQLSFRINKNEANKYEQICRDEQKIDLTYDNKSLNILQKFVVEPKETVITQSGCILRAYNPSIAEIQDFNIENIVCCKQLPSKSRNIELAQSVTFKVIGRLARSYELKEGERVTKSGSENGIDYKIITNTLEDKNELLKRLLRYGVSCKIMYPAAFQKIAIEQIKKIKSNYE